MLYTLSRCSDADIPDDVEPAAWQPVGNYAVQITWQDGFSQVWPRGCPPRPTPVTCWHEGLLAVKLCGAGRRAYRPPQAAPYKLPPANTPARAALLSDLQTPHELPSALLYSLLWQVAPYELLDSLPRLSWEDARARQAMRARLAAASSGGSEGPSAAQQILASAQAAQLQQ